MTTIDEYLVQPYAITLTPDRDSAGEQGWVASVEELPGCVSQGATPEAAVEHVREAMAAWIEAAVANGSEVPEPRSLSRYSGRFVVRLPESLHAELARRADLEGTSLNQFVVAALAGAVGWGAPQQQPKPEPYVFGYQSGAPSRFAVTFGEPIRFAGGKSTFVGSLDPQFNAMPIEKLELTPRRYRALKGAGIDTVGKLVSKRPEEIAEIPTFGKKSVNDLQQTVFARLLKIAGG